MKQIENKIKYFMSGFGVTINTKNINKRDELTFVVVVIFDELTFVVVVIYEYFVFPR